jgi:iron complex outermembrane receptor protein
MGASFAALAATATPALAQAPSFTIEELVVTAEKREQSLQDVPVAVSAYTSERRDVLGLTAVEDFARFTPSLSYTNNDRLSIRGFGRLTNAIGTDPAVALYSDGIFTNSMFDASTPPIFIERTEILRGPQGTLYGRNSIGGTMNIIAKRPSEEFTAEVRGMAGNYGAWRTDALVSGPITDNLRFLLGGSLDRRHQGYIKNIGPAGDTAAMERSTIEAQLEADLGDNVTARVRYTKFDWDDSYGVGNTLVTNISPQDITSFVGAGTSALYYNTARGYTGVNPATSDPYKIDTNFSALGRLSNHHRLHFDVLWDLGGVTLKYIGGIQMYTYDTGGDSDGTPRTATQNIALPDLDGPGPLTAFTASNVSTDARTFYQERQKWWSNELNLSSNNDSPFQWILGLYQYGQSYDNFQGIRVVGDQAMFTPISLAGGMAAPNPRGAFLYVDGHLDAKSYAAFGQFDWEFVENFTLTGGLRYTSDEKTGFDSARYVGRTPSAALLSALLAQGIPPAFSQGLAIDLTALQTCGGPTIASCAANPATADLYAAPGGGLRRNLSADYDAWTGTLGVQWEPDSDTNLYLRYSRGYKSGGWYGAGGLTPNPYVDPEEVDSFELGAKKTFGGRLQINTALFYSDYRGVQAPLVVPLGSITGTRLQNLDSEVWGLEIEALWSPLDNLQLLMNYGHLNTEITNGCCFVDSGDPLAVARGARPTGVTLPNGNRLQTLVGNQLPMSAENKFTVGGTYTWEFSPGSLTASATYSFTDDQQSLVFANPLYQAPANEIADFRLLWKDAQDRYTFIGFVKNAFDEVAFQRSIANPTTPTAAGTRREVILGIPRTYGVELQYRF